MKCWYSPQDNTMNNIQLNWKTTTYIFNFFLIVGLPIPSKFTTNDDVDLPPQLIRIFHQNLSKSYSPVITVFKCHPLTDLLTPELPAFCSFGWACSFEPDVLAQAKRSKKKNDHIVEQSRTVRQLVFPISFLDLIWSKCFMSKLATVFDSVIFPNFKIPNGGARGGAQLSDGWDKCPSCPPVVAPLDVSD